MAALDPSDFLAHIASTDTVVGVVGLGYVGLPLVLTYVRRGFTVIGFDVDQEKVRKLHAGESIIDYLPKEELKSLCESGRFRPTCDYAQVVDCDALLLCVPTPLNKHREPEMRYVIDTATSIAPYLHRAAPRSAAIVILESTTYPRTTDDLVRPLLEEGSGLRAGEGFYLAYGPEREDPGNPNFDTQRIPKVVGGYTPACLQVAVALYRSVLDEVVPVSSTAVAEMTKLFENIFRSVNIALVNEIKTVCERMDIDVWEMIDAAATKPFGFMSFYPGPGLGGHCIPIDPFYLTWKAREYDLSTRFIELAGEVNTAMPRHVVDRLAEGLNDAAKPLKNADIIILGIAYKRDVDDIRESPALKILDLLGERGAQICYHDPFVPQLKKTRKYHFELQSIDLTADRLAACDAVLIVTDHSQVDYALVVGHAPLVVDTRNATKDVTHHRDRILKA